MGGTAVLILERDVLARRDHIHALLGSKGQQVEYLRKRPGIHNRIIQHLDITLSYTTWTWKKNFDWRRAQMEKGPKSMRTEESRREYAMKWLQREWEDMGVTPDGISKGNAIEIE